MIVDDKLIVLENFRPDLALPKFQESEARKLMDVANTMISRVRLRPPAFEDDWDNSFDGSAAVEMGEMPLMRMTPKRSWWYRLWHREPKEPKPTMTVEEFFSHVKHSAHELTLVKERAAGYESALRKAKQMGQKALYEQLSDGLEAHRMEAQLVAIGLVKYVTEESIVTFAKQSKRGLRLDWIANFTRQIPEDVAGLKARADELGAFDNYVVLHYDPKKKAVADTKAEKEAKKDPILFGVMKGRRFLYFVGDWVDEYCDLTLDQFADVMGADRIQQIADLPTDYHT
mgnify:CR=1 FL=1